MWIFWSAIAHGEPNYALVPGSEVSTFMAGTYAVGVGQFTPGAPAEVVWVAEGHHATVFDERLRPPVALGSTPLGLTDSADVLVADFDGDGLDDLVTFEDQAVATFTADGNGRFESSYLNTDGFVHWMAVGDVDADGDIDLVPEVGCGWSSFLVGDGNAQFVERPFGCTNEPAVGGEHILVDVTGDGWLDYVGILDGGGLAVLPFDGAGFGGAVQQYAVAGQGGAAHLAAGDLTGDGVIDVALVQANYDGTLWLRVFGGGGGYLTEFDAKAAPSAVFAVADVDADGDADLLYDEGDQLDVLLQDQGALLPALTFKVAGGADRPPLVADLTDDGCPDIARFSGWSSTFTVVVGACAGRDADGDGVFDPSDPCPYVRETAEDLDNDGVPDDCDLCLTGANNLRDWADGDWDGRIDRCDTCPVVTDDGTDDDHDEVGDACDNCVGPYSSYQLDRDGDGLGDVCDPCALLVDDGADRDGDGLGDACEACPDVALADDVDQVTDSDGDGLGDACDVCYVVADDQADGDGDGVGDACDLCPGVAGGRADLDRDGFGTECDVCPSEADDQADADGDGVGDACELTTGPPSEEGGKCATGSGGRGSVVWTLALALVGVRRRRARRSPSPVTVGEGDGAGTARGREARRA